MNIIIILLLIISAFPVSGNCETKNKFTVGANGSLTSSESQNSTNLSLDLGYDKISGSAGFETTKMKITSETIRTIYLNTKFKLAQTVGLGLDYSNSPEANDYKTDSWNFNGNIRVPIFAKSLYTKLTAAYGLTNNWQKILYGRNKSTWRDFKQNSLNISLSQDLPLYFYCSCRFAKYQYNPTPEEIEKVFSNPQIYLITSAQSKNNIYNLVTGFSDKSFSLSIGDSPFEFLDLSLDYARTYYLTDSTYLHSLTLNVSVYLGNFNCGCSLNGQSPSTDPKDIARCVSLSVGYNF